VKLLQFGPILTLGCASLFGQHYIISTIIGEGATGALLHNPTSVAVDSADNVYFGDWSGIIRKISARDGAVTVVAGTGSLGYSGDGGPAISAMLGKGISFALDAAGNIYIADYENNRIRRVEATTGIITTVAGTGAATDSGDGGPAVNAGVFWPTGIAVDGAGDLYFSSSWSRVRKLIASTGIIETVAGRFGTSFSGDGGLATAASFWDPIPSVVDHNGNIYITDYENSRIRLVTASTGIVATIAGSSACAPGPAPFVDMVCQGGFGGDGGPAANAILNHAEAVALDSAGNLFIADTINHRIRRVDASTRIIYTIAGNGVSGFSGDGGLALAAEITFPVGIATDSFGRVYFADENNNRIRVLTPLAPPLYRFRQGPRR
jgi:sugar lactone lactonase YvrE